MGSIVAGQVDVFLAAPYAPRGGGMGRIMAYLAAEAARLPGYRFSLLETRGAGPVWLSPVYVAMAALRLIAARLRGVCILHVNMAEGGSVWRNGALIGLARLLHAPVLLHLHAADIIGFWHSLGRPGRAAMGGIFRAAGGVVVLGNHWNEFLTGTLGVRPGRIMLVPNGVPDDRRAPCGSGGGETGPAPKGEPKLVFVGNLLPRKGLADLLDVLAQPALRARPWTLTIAGGGDAAWITAFCARFGMTERVHLPGWLPRRRVTDLIAAADILVLPSYQEALPLVLLEAACQGRAIITTAVGAIGEYFTDDVDALIVPPGDASALRAAILSLLADQKRRHRLGQGARALYERGFSMPAMTGGLEAAYRALQPAMPEGHR